MIERIIKTKEINNRLFSLETGFLAHQAHGAVVARYGDTVVLSTVVVGAKDEKMDNLPLSVEYEERLYAGGIIKGSRWVKREGRPTDPAILNGRLIDRSIRPLFPKEFRNEIQVIVTILSVDDENDPVIVGLIATSAALLISGAPFNGPIGASRIGIINDQLVANAPLKDMENSIMDLIVSSTESQVLMVEMGGNQIHEDKVLEAINFAHQSNQEIISLIKEFKEEVVNKLGYKFVNKAEELTPEQIKEAQSLDEVAKYIKDNFPAGLLEGTSSERSNSNNEFIETVYKQFEGKAPKARMYEIFEKTAKKVMREKIVNTKTRVDGRKLDEIRPLYSEVSLLPRTHGSAVFKRGDTVVMTIATLGSTALEQSVEGMYGEESKRYIHHYNFPPFSTGETGRVGQPKRREIGHGALAERALEPVLPSKEKFPYTIRLVSEVMSSNGSTSMASTCGSTLALMDAGVPIIEPVSGIAMGLIKEGDETLILSDIMGIEDFYGDMDFKVTGTKNGVTALQMDVKIAGLTPEIFVNALAQAKVGRMFILDSMLATLNTPRESLSIYAPKIKTLKINPKKIGELIGPGGKIIRGIQEDTATTVSVEEDGTVYVSGIDPEGLQNALDQIDMITKEVEIGKIYKGRVTRIMDFGAFVEVLPGQEGLVHVSELAEGFVKNVRDYVREGEEFDVKVVKVDDQGRINLSRKAVLAQESQVRSEND